MQEFWGRKRTVAGFLRGSSSYFALPFRIFVIFGYFNIVSKMSSSIIICVLFMAMSS